MRQNKIFLRWYLVLKWQSFYFIYHYSWTTHTCIIWKFTYASRYLFPPLKHWKKSNCPYLYFRSYWNDGRFSPNRKMYRPSQKCSILWDFVGNSFNGIFAKRVILHMIFIGKIWTNLTNAIMSKYFYFHTYCYLAWRSIWCNN